jgi:hypothetical protein
VSFANDHQAHAGGSFGVLRHDANESSRKELLVFDRLQAPNRANHPVLPRPKRAASHGFRIALLGEKKLGINPVTDQ